MTKLETSFSLDETDREFIVDFWYWIADKQMRHPTNTDDKQLYKRLEKCKDVYNKFYPEYEKDGRGTQPEFEELLSYVHRHLMEDMGRDGWLVYNYVRASIHRVIIRYDDKMFKMWVKRQEKTKKELRA